MEGAGACGQSSAAGAIFVRWLWNLEEKEEASFIEPGVPPPSPIARTQRGHPQCLIFISSDGVQQSDEVKNIMGFGVPCCVAVGSLLNLADLFLRS